MHSKIEKTITHGVESIWRDGIAFEEIWCIYLKAVTSKIAGKELDGD
jgi:hypothetical protein